MERQDRYFDTPQREDGNDSIPLMDASRNGNDWPNVTDYAVVDAKTQSRRRSTGGCLKTCLLLLCGLVLGLLFGRSNTPDRIMDKIDEAGRKTGIPALSDLRNNLRLPFTGGHLNSDRVVVTMRTGTSVLYDRLPPHLFAFEQEKQLYSEVLIYSDWETNVAGWPVRNALANVSDTIKGQADFKAYYELERIVKENGPVNSFKDGHKIDKYKFMPLWADAFRRHPDKDWYVGTEDDAFIFYKPLLKLLSTLNPAEQVFLGCTNYLVPSNELFANGGCTYVLSRALMEATFGSSPTFADVADARLEGSCCGDGELGVSIFHAPKTTIKKLHPESKRRFSGSSPWEHWYDEGMWCEEVFTLHHVDAWATAKLYNFANEIEEKLPKNDSVRFVDVHDHFLPAFLQSVLGRNASSSSSASSNTTTVAASGPRSVQQESWLALASNVSPRVAFPLANLTSPADRDKKHWSSPLCSGACDDDASCFVWSFLPPSSASASNKVEGDCFLLRNTTIFGTRSDDKGIVSGWRTDRIEKWREGRWCTAPGSWRQAHAGEL